MNDFLWWRDGVIYQIYPRSFQDSNGDGVGDLAGITARLDYLADLGVDAIWLSPIYPSPMYDFGYDVSDYEAIDPVFGDLQGFDRLVAEAHRRGIRVVLDLVMNHTSHLHPWFVASRSSRDHPLRDWYIWQDPAPGGRLPNNWESVFGGPAWQLDSSTGQYYYHQFLKEQPDLNWWNPEVRQRMYQMMRFWLERGVDGFRLDVVMSYFKDARFRSNPTTLFGRRAFDRQKHLYDWDQPEIALALGDIRQVLDEYPERMAVGEVIDLDMAVRYVGADKLSLAFNFTLMRQPWRPRAIQKAILDYISRLPSGTWPCYVLGNHDVTRFPTRFGGGPFSDARTKVAAALLLTQRGTPFIYYGEEIGMPNTRIPRVEIQDPPGRRYWPFYAGRDGERTPMQWSAELQAGFSTGKPWLRLHPGYRQRHVADQQADPGSVLSFYKRLLRLRKESPALLHGDTQFLLRRPTEALVYLRRSETQTMLVALNFYAWPVQVKLDGGLPAASWEQRLTSAPGGQVGPMLNGQIALAPFEASVWELSTDSGSGLSRLLERRSI
jgi:alpha-glucosidase